MATRSGSHLIISKPKPTLCKVVDYMANPGESKCFIKNPDYGEVTAKMLQAYTFVPQKNAYNPNLGAALSLVLMILIFICMGIMNRFSYDDGESMVMM